MKMMTDHRVRHVPVIDGDSELMGLISMGDVNACHDVPELGATHYASATVRGLPCPDEIVPIADVDDIPDDLKLGDRELKAARVGKVGGPSRAEARQNAATQPDADAAIAVRRDACRRGLRLDGGGDSARNSGRAGQLCQRSGGAAKDRCR